MYGMAFPVGYICHMNVRDSAPYSNVQLPEQHPHSSSSNFILDIYGNLDSTRLCKNY